MLRLVRPRRLTTPGLKSGHLAGVLRQTHSRPRIALLQSLMGVNQDHVRMITGIPSTYLSRSRRDAASEGPAGPGPRITSPAVRLPPVIRLSASAAAIVSAYVARGVHSDERCFGGDRDREEVSGGLRPALCQRAPTSAGSASATSHGREQPTRTLLQTRSGTLSCGSCR